MVFDVVPAFEGTEKEAQAASELQRILFLLCCSVLRSASVILAFIVSYFYWLLVLEVFTLFHFILLMYYVLHLIYIGYCYIYALLHLYVYCLCIMCCISYILAIAIYMLYCISMYIAYVVPLSPRGGFPLRGFRNGSARPLENDRRRSQD